MGTVSHERKDEGEGGSKKELVRREQGGRRDKIGYEELLQHIPSY